MKANCISCQEIIDVGNNPQLGSKITCPMCGANQEVSWLDPIELDWPAEEYFDYIDDEGYTDDF